MDQVKRYRKFPIFRYPERTWMDQEITKAPIWCSVDLRDGNQALVDPMTVEEKVEFFQLLCKLGFKEIEVGFPAASQIEFDYLRTLVEKNLIPEDVTVQVLVQCREELLERSFQALQGVKKAIVHIYNSTSVLQRDVVFGKSREEITAIALSAVEMVKRHEKDFSGELRLEYSPESFTGTEMDYALEICNAVISAWGTKAGREIIINLPNTVEMHSPNVYADQIEFMSKNMKEREHVILSVHPHNDRGEGIASAELALLAGAQRVEGTLFGNGERTGNVDILTLAYNLFSHGIDPKLNLENVREIQEVYERCTKMSVPDRHPYAGKLVFTAFSGSHQDAINKGVLAMRERKNPFWEVPYLPIDPADIGRQYEPVVRINSQSGKGGVAYLMSRTHNLELPRRLQVEFSRIVQRHTDTYGGEINAETLWKIFADEYLPTSAAPGLQPWGRFELRKSQVGTVDDEHVELHAELTDNGVLTAIDANGTGPIDAFVSALHQFDLDVRVLDYSEHAMSQGRDAKAASYVEAAVDGKIVWGVGIDSSITRASYKAVISAVNRALRDQ